MTTSDSTTGATDDIRFVEEPDDGLAARLDAELAAFNFDATGIRDARDFAATLYDEGGALMAGVQGWTWGATCWVERLWVRADACHRGLGRRRMMAVESEARARGCGRLALTTHRFQAPTSTGGSDSKQWASCPSIRWAMRACWCASACGR